jgi:anti-anti-sigma factor
MPDPGSFQLTREDLTNRISLLALRGDADRSRTDAVGRAIEEARGEGRELIVDLSQTAYLDSSMLAALVTASQRTRRRSHPLVVICRSERLRRSFQLKGLERILRMADTREEALAILSADGDSPPGGL